MPKPPKFAFAPFGAPGKSVLVVFCDQDVAFGPTTRKALGTVAERVKQAAASEKFTGKAGSALDLIAPAGVASSRLIVVGLGKPDDSKPRDCLKLGGATMGRLPSAATEVTVLAESGAGAFTAGQAADLALGARLRAYTFDRYKTKKGEDKETPAAVRVTIQTADVAAAQKAHAIRNGLGDGIVLARDLVNEPPNILYPEEFAERTEALRKVGVAVEIFDVAAMKKLGMNALLGVGQGSRKDSRMVVMRWNGSKKGAAPVAFIGKGVTFDTGGISIKPASGMEDMKGDMAGAACVTGLMHALAARKAKVNAIGAIGIVENMPDGNAQRPGDIVTTMSGQTIEIINTDAEGRLVLADVLHYVNTRHKPRFMVNLATLTGAIIVALGVEHAGLFSNNDELSQRLTAVGLSTGEKVWRMPLSPEYDKLIDSKFADMKNSGGRYGGSITAAQLLQRFVGETPWAHLDIAGTGMSSPSSDINRSWGSGWGVRLLDRLVSEHYES